MEWANAILTALAAENQVIYVAAWATVILAAITVVLTLVLVLFRAVDTILNRFRDNRQHQFISKVLAVVGRTTDTIPGPNWWELRLQFSILSEFLDLVGGQAGQRIAIAAANSGYPEAARRLLTSPDSLHQILGARILGFVGSQEYHVQSLTELAGDDDPVVALAAADACLRLDRKRGIDQFVDILGKRPDWPIDVVVTALSRYNRKQLAKSLIRRARDCEAGEIGTIAQLADRLDIDLGQSSRRRMLEHAIGDRERIAILRQVREEPELTIVREFLDDKQWIFRATAASTLARFQVPESRTLLSAALDDGNWWVRYRAALTLVKLGLDANESPQSILDQARGTAGADAVSQALAEQGANP